MPSKVFQKDIKKYYKSQDTLPKVLDDGGVKSQSLEDYYVKLQITLEDPNKKFGEGARDLEEVRNLELKSFFDRIDVYNPEAGKILVTGVAGVGKTTLMHYASYAWACGKLWQTKFDVVVRVRLKDLLDDSWKEDYKGKGFESDLANFPLASFIHSSLPQSLKKSYKVKDIDKYIKSDETKGTCLLLDGYDEVADILLVRDPKYVKEREIFE